MCKIFFLFAWLSFSASAFSQNLVAWYPFNGNANDESGNGRHGTVMNGALLTTDRFNQGNKAYYFDGDNDHIEFSATGLPSTNRTVMFWLNPATGNQPSYPLCYGGSSCGESFLTGFNASGCGCYNTQGHCGSNALATSAWTTSPENTWVHFTISINSSAIKIYINGLPAANNSGFSVATYTSGTKMFIGALITPDGLSTYDDGSGGNFNGKLDDVRIYDAAMSDAQVLQLYQSELTGLVVYYPFNNNVNDESGNGINLINTGVTFTVDRSGNPNSAGSFNGSSKLYCSDNDLLDLTNDFSICFWIKRTQSILHSFVLSKHLAGDDGSGSWGIASYDGSTLTFKATPFWAGSCPTTPAIPQDQWQFVTFVYKKSTGQWNYYIDGVNVGAGTQAFAIQNTGFDFTIGSSQGYGNYLTSILDDIRIYNRVLLPNEILQLADIPMMPDLIAYLPMNGDANDKSGNNRNGTPYGGAALTTDKYDNANSAYYITNPECGISLDNTNNLDFVGQPFAISAWVKYSNIPAADFAVVAKHNCGVPNGYVLSVYNNIPRFYLSTGGWNTISATETYNDNKWHHLVATYDGIGSQKLYVDGELKASAASVVYNNPSGSSALVIIGDASGSCAGGTFSASIDEVKIYGAALSAAQVSALYKQSRGSSNAISFDGVDDIVSIPNGGVLNNLQTGTIDLWVKWKGINQDQSPLGAFGAILARQSNSQFSNQIIALNGQDPNSAKIIWMPYSSVSTAITSTLSPGNRWNHLAIVYSSGSHEMYLNGVLVGISSDAGTIANAAVPLTLGGWIDDGACFGNAELDEVRIWNTTLSQAQIRDWMNRKITPDHPAFANLVGYYTFDEQNMLQTYDIRGAKTGSLINGSTWVTSGAPIGDASVANFTSPHGTTTLTLSTGENFSVTGAIGTALGVSIYEVKDPPENQAGILGLGSNDHYFGVHTSTDNISPSYTAIYNYTGNPFVSSATEPTLQLFKRADNSIAIWSQSGATLNTTANTLTVSGQTTEYILGSSGYGLPVTLLNLQARKTNTTTAQLTWQTATEINNKGFEVQRSFDGNYYADVQFVNGAGNSNDIKDYSITDVPGRTGRVFYRLKQIDFDGNSKLSNIVSVLFDKQGIIKVYPSPAQQRITIEGADLYNRVQIFDTGGGLVKEQFNNGQYLLNMSLDGLRSGTYLLRLSNSSESQTLKLVIVR